MSIFEHSLAFAESEAMISNQLGLSLWSAHKANRTISNTSQPDPVGKLFTRSEILDKMNTPPEVLLMLLISSLNNLSSQVLGALNMQARFRLINTGIWGICFMSAFGWGFFSLRPESGPESIILRFPTVCIVGFIPHLLILVGILLCTSIYALALLLCFLSPPSDEPPPRTFAERFRIARENMQANAQLSSIRLDMTEDFYTALLKIGFTALTVASEAVYLNEGRRINVATSTWLEEERLTEIEAFEKSHDPVEGVSVRLAKQAAADQHSTGRWTSGYDRVVSFTTDKFGSGFANTRQRGDGVGHMQRGGRYLVAAKFFRGIFWLFVSWNKVITNKLMDRARISWRPQWLRLPKPKEGLQVDKEEGRQQKETIDFWILSDEGVLSLPENDDVDVEQEMKRRLNDENDRWSEEEEQTLDSRLYHWWASGGWFGEKDDSGSYTTPSKDDDTTSMVSMSTNASEVSHKGIDDEFMDVDGDAGSGASTPTQRRPFSRGLSPSDPNVLDALDPSADYSQLSPHHLATLLDPKTPQQRSEARMLAHHLNNPGITTRSQYRHSQSFANAKLLTSTRYRPANSSIPATGRLSPEDEAYLLEQLILTRRSQHASSSTNQGAAGTWRDGAVGMGSGGPQCVVCQSAPRTVLAWPCRCLSLCEDCRVSLAMNNFGTCVCCRQNVVGFSRLFVP